MIVVTLISFVLLAGFIALSIVKIGKLSCWSKYGAEWAKIAPIHNVNLWSAVNVVSALLIVPPMVQRGADNPLQFLGFFAPLFLLLVGFTPDYQDTKKKNAIHQVGAWGCVVMVMLWLILIRHLWFIVLPCFVLALVVMLGTRSEWKDWELFGECAMFASVYVALLIP